MSYAESGDEQSEDGELRQSPPPDTKQKTGIMDFSLSEEEGDNIDSLDIKPPQARVSTQSSRSKRRAEGEESRSRHKRSERHRDEGRHSHREKHHREKHSMYSKEREHYQREKDRYYRDKQAFEQTSNYTTMSSNTSYRERNKEDSSSSSSRSRHESRSMKYEEKKSKDNTREVRYIQEKHNRRERYDDDNKRDKADKTLQDLRERLLSKRSYKSSDEEGGSYKQEKRRHKEMVESLDSALQGAAGAYVKEIINISTEEKKYRKEEKLQQQKEEEKLSEEERAEQEARRAKLLEAEREMERQKEQLRLERERRHLERAKRKLDEEEEAEEQLKKMRTEDDDEMPVVMVSDNSEEEIELDEDDVEKEHTDDDDDDDVNNERSYRSVKSRSSSVESRNNKSSGGSTDSREVVGVVSEEEEGEEEVRRSRSVTPTTDKSRSPSPKSNGKVVEEGEKVVVEKEEEVVREVKELDKDLPPYYPAIQGCRSVEEFQCLNRIEEGTYGVVYRARDKRTQEIVALKRLKMEKEKEGFPITSLREINTLLKGQHPNIVTVREIVVGSNMDKIFIVMDYVEHDLKSLMETMRHKKQMFMPGEVKCLLRQLLAAVAHLHDNWILHRDLKTSNLLLSHKGILKVGDFGLAREYGSPLKQYTPIVVTLWYRAPELLLCAKEYSTPIDMWSVGCIFAELLLMNALFPGKSEVDQLNRIFKDLGTPSEKIWPGFNKLPTIQKMKFTDYPVSNLRSKFHMLTECGLGLLTKFLTYNPAQRITAEEALQHAYFAEPPLPIDPAMFPTWPAKSELGQRRALAASPKPPSGGREYKQLERDDDGIGFRLGISAADSRRLAMGGGFSLKF